MILDKLLDVKYWYEFKQELEESLYVDKITIKNIDKVIESGVEKISLYPIPIPTRKEIAKYKNSKKRVIYTYQEPYNTYLKMVNWLLQRDKTYSDSFCSNSYAYRKGVSISDAVKKIQQTIFKKKYKYFIKTDFKDYFNSINVEKITSKLVEFVKKEDLELTHFLADLISEPRVIANGKIIREYNKGVMAGTPLSGYLANVYMNDVDWEMNKRKLLYVRYADDVFILTNDVEQDLITFKNLISPLEVTLNDKKTNSGLVEDGFTVLGFEFKDNEIDIDKAKVQKMFTRIKRRSRWFKQWEKKNNVKNEVMVRTFIKGMNAKLYSADEDERQSWSRWYFANITTTRSLERVDSYLVQYIRYLVSGKHLGYAAHSKVKYDYVKKLGFINLVNSYYRYRKGERVNV